MQFQVVCSLRGKLVFPAVPHRQRAVRAGQDGRFTARSAHCAHRETGESLREKPGTTQQTAIGNRSGHRGTGAITGYEGGGGEIVL